MNNENIKLPEGRKSDELAKMLMRPLPDILSEIEQNIRIIAEVAHRAEEIAKMQKCNLCAERWLSNQKPTSVEACRTYALDAGPVDELIAKYGDVKEGEGFVYSPIACPSVVLKPKKTGV